MSYALTFYTASQTGLRDELLRPSGAFREKLSEVWKTVYDPDTGESYDSALDVGLAEIRKALAANAPKIDFKGQLALVAAIEAYGQKLGALEHPSGAGEEFRREFLEETAAKLYGLPPLGEYLTHRPLFGLETREYPEWGGLVRDELAKLPNISPEAEIENAGHREWLAELAKFIEQAKTAGTDLLTVYR